MDELIVVHLFVYTDTIIISNRAGHCNIMR